MFHRWFYLAYLAGHLAVQVRAQQCFWGYQFVIANNSPSNAPVYWVAYVVLGGNPFNYASGTTVLPPCGYQVLSVSGASAYCPEGFFMAGNAQETEPDNLHLVYGSGGSCASGGQWWTNVCCAGPFTPQTNAPVLKPVFARRRLPGGGWTNAIIGFYRK